jgi:succinyl-CoA synthetase alpha subunit
VQHRHLTGEIALLPSDGPNVGIVSRSGTLTYQALYELKQKGIGVSTCVGIGGDPVPGTSFVDCLAEFEKDPETHAIMLIGEIGGSAEEEAADFITASLQLRSGCMRGSPVTGRKMGHARASSPGAEGAQGRWARLCRRGRASVTGWGREAWRSRDRRGLGG